VRWLDLRFEPIIDSIPKHLFSRLEPAEIFHQLLEHRWYMAERSGEDVSLEDALADYLALLSEAPDERVQLEDKALAEGADPTGPIPIASIDLPDDDPIVDTVPPTHHRDEHAGDR